MPVPLSIVDYIEQGALGTADWLISAGQSESQVTAALQQQFPGLSPGDAGTLTEIAFQASQAASELGFKLGFTPIENLSTPINPGGTPGFDSVDVEIWWDDPRDNSHHYQRASIDIPSGSTVDEALAAVDQWVNDFIDEYHLTSEGIEPEQLILGLFRGPA